MTTTRSWAASTSEPATLQRRSEGHRAGGAHKLGHWSGFSRSLGLECVTHPIWSSLWRESLRRCEAHELVPEELVIPIRNTSTVLPAGRVGTGDPRHKDWGENCSMSGDGRGSLCYELPFGLCSELRGELQLYRRQPTPSTRPKMSLQPRFGPFFSKPLLLTSQSSFLVPLIPVPPHPCSQATEDQMRLLRLQRRLEDELGGQFLDLSLHDTVTTLILSGQNKRAEQLARDFRIPDKR